jgi:hypothetical protein
MHVQADFIRFQYSYNPSLRLRHRPPGRPCAISYNPHRPLRHGKDVVRDSGAGNENQSAEKVR